MTAGELVTALYTELGERTDCDPYVGGVLTPATPGYQRILSWINKAYRYVAGYKFANGRQLHFRELERSDRLQAIQDTAIVATVAASPRIGPDATFVDGLFEGWVVIDAQGETYEVMRSTYVAGDFLDLEFCHAFTGLLGDTITLYRRAYPIRTGLGVLEWTFSAYPLEISRIFDLSQNVELSRVSRDVSLFEGRRDVGDPGQFAIRGSSIVFDRAPSDPRWMLVEYTAVPDALSATDANDVPILPENYHQAIELFALYLGYKYEEESKEAYYALSNFTAFMQTTRSPSDFEDEYTTKRYRVDTGRI